MKTWNGEGEPVQDAYLNSASESAELQLRLSALRDSPPDADWRQDRAADIWRQEAHYEQPRGSRSSWESKLDRHATSQADRSRARFYAHKHLLLAPLSEDIPAQEELSLLDAIEHLEHALRTRLAKSRLSKRTRDSICETLLLLAKLASS